MLTLILLGLLQANPPEIFVIRSKAEFYTVDNSGGHCLCEEFTYPNMTMDRETRLTCGNINYLGIYSQIRTYKQGKLSSDWREPKSKWPQLPIHKACQR